MSLSSDAYSDSALVRVCLKTLAAAGRLVGHERARAVASLGWRAQAAWTGDGFFKLAHRISPRLRDENPELFKIPCAWTAHRPIVTVRRLGVELQLDLRDNLQALLFFAGTYEPQVLEFLDKELRQCDVFVDVGAHIGWMSLVAARRLTALGGGKVYAFEPTSDSADKVRVAADRNGVLVSVVQTALGDGPSETTIFGDSNYDEHDTGVRSQYGHGAPVERVPVMAFDQWAQEEALSRMDVVKIDVEGAEPAVIAGMTESLRRLRPRALIVEVKDYSFERSGGGEVELVQLLASLSYEDQGIDLNRNRVFRPAR